MRQEKADGLARLKHPCQIHGTGSAGGVSPGQAGV